ncbi:alpha/beta fold hydrolase [Rhizobium leguminosarum]
MELLPGATYAPTLYSFGDRIESWAEKALALTTAKRLVVVGCSVGGSCALEVAALAPDRVAALVLIGKDGSTRQSAYYPELRSLRADGTAGGDQFDYSPSFGDRLTNQGPLDIFVSAWPAPNLPDLPQHGLERRQRDFRLGLIVLVRSCRMGCWGTASGT